MVLLTWLLLSLPAPAEELAATEQKLNPMQVVTEIPTTIQRGLKAAFSKEAIWPWVGIISSTGLMIKYDAEILQNLQHEGRALGIGNEDKTKTIVSLGSLDILRLPSDTGSFLYFLGDGWVHMGIAAGFAATGYFDGSSRAFNTGLQMVHGMVVSSLFSQGIKRSTGRESPSMRTEPTGAWRPFPSVAEYGRKTAKYDAFPSGHIMTAALVATVIDENYPEYSYITYPVAGVWLTALGFQMVNNGVHWASDYPLGIGLGVLFGKMATRMGKPEKENKKVAQNWVFYPSIFEDTETFNVLYSY